MNNNFITKGCQPHGRQPFNIDFKLKPTLHPDIQEYQPVGNSALYI